jgi:AcrR family transcriptional regulator
MANLPVCERILVKAGEFFHVRGYGAVRLEEVIGATGISKGAFYQDFSSKSDLGYAWLERLSKRMKIMHRNFLLYSGAMAEAQNLKATWPLDDALVCAEALCEIKR